MFFFTTSMLCILQYTSLLDGDPARGGAGSKISRTTTLEFQDFSNTYAFLQDFPGIGADFMGAIGPTANKLWGRCPEVASTGILLC